jgi:predicted RND superfamily exporter protein
LKGLSINIPRLLVRYRLPLFLLMTALAVVCALMIPHVNVNSNMVVYLPDSSPMKQGMDILETQLPDIQSQMQEFGSVFADGNDLMPKGLPRTLAFGVSLLFLVLLVMSASVAEVVLFLITVGFAVAINMGTNALLPSVSMMTNTLSSVLQMVLSMDYSIILMNRYRQEKMRGALPAAAMETAIDRAAATILSSAFTTIVSLLMLCFIKMKIGADLGVVLAKGVALSLLCNFTVLPSLILWADKAIDATRKKVPALPASPLASFQERFRVPIAILFLALFVSFTFLQRRTPMGFAPQWESNASDVSSGENALMLLYANDEEMQIPGLLEKIGQDSLVHSCISYPSLALQPRTIEELGAMAEGLPAETPVQLPEELLQLVYYAHSHPKRTERFSFQEVQEAASSFADMGLVPDNLLQQPPQPAPVPKPEPEPIPEPEPVVEPVAVPADTLATPVDTLSIPKTETKPQQADSIATPTLRFTYEQASTPLTAAGMAAFTGQEARQVNTIYRLAGRRNGKMTPLEFVTYVKNNILGNKLYAAFIPKGTEQQLAQLQTDLQAALAAGPPVSAPVQADTLLPAAPPVPQADTLLLAAEVPIPAEEPAEEPEPVYEPTPQDRLLDMVLSGKRYSASQMHQALSAAGIPVSRDQLDLLFLYMGAQRDYQPETAIAPLILLDYVADTLLTAPALAAFVPDSARVMINDAREQLLSGVGMLHGVDYSAAAILSGYEAESAPTFDFVTRVRSLADEALQQPHYWIGESQMYKELKDGFPREVLLLTLLTVLSIFLIVALTFRSILIPIPLVMTILTGVYVNVWASGLGGNSMYYLSYLIIQGILMGATIDYSILFTSYYLNGRKEHDRKGALEAAYRGSSHSILTSGLILSLVPYVMYLTMSDPMIALILRSLSIGALAVLILILFLLPGVLATLDPILRKR